MCCSEPNHERALSNERYYEQTLAEQQQQQQQPCSGDEDADDEPVNPRPSDTYKASDEFQIYERLCRGEQTHVRAPRILRSSSNRLYTRVPRSALEVCMGMGIPISMGFPWDSHGNGSSFRLLMGTVMGMGIVLMGMRIAYFIGEK